MNVFNEFITSNMGQMKVFITKVASLDGVSQSPDVRGAISHERETAVLYHVFNSKYDDLKRPEGSTSASNHCNPDLFSALDEIRDKERDIISKYSTDNASILKLLPESPIVSTQPKLDLDPLVCVSLLEIINAITETTMGQLSSSDKINVIPAVCNEDPDDSFQTPPRSEQLLRINSTNLISISRPFEFDSSRFSPFVSFSKKTSRSRVALNGIFASSSQPNLHKMDSGEVVVEPSSDLTTSLFSRFAIIPALDK